MTATTTTSGLIDIGTTRLYHEVRGSGPALLLISGGTGDAGEWAQVAPVLADGLTVVTYDRRGFSRSPCPDGWTTTSMAEQADDAAALLRALDLAPAVVVGHSGGGAIACSLVERHPGLVRHAVIYEAPLIAALPDGEKVISGFQISAAQAMAVRDPRRAMELFMRANAGDELVDQLLEFGDPAQLDRIMDNGFVFFAIDIPMYATFLPDRERIRRSGVPLTVVAGQESRGTWMGTSAMWLAEGTGVELTELPGGHVGYLTHPEQFVELVRRVAR